MARADRFSYPTDILRRHWPNDKAAELIVKAATSPASITGSGWADALAETALSDFLLTIGPQSAGAALLKRGISLAFNGAASIQVPSLTAAASGTSFVQEGSAIPVRSLSVTSGVTLSPRKLGTIAAFSRELFLHSVPSIETLVRATLAESVAAELDATMFDTTGADQTRPAGLVVGLSPLTAAAASDVAMVTDIAGLAGAVAPVSANAPLLFVASPKQAARMRFSTLLKDIEVFSSSALADKTVLCVASNCLVSATDPAVRFEASDQGTLVMRDDPTALGAAGTPPIVGAPARSLYQTDTIGLRLLFGCSWALRSPTGLSFVQNVNW
jgi:hypothetical protein